MSTITIRETEAIRLDAGFCTQPIILPCPTTVKPGETKWGNIVSAYEPASLDSVTTNMNIDSVNALRVSGVSFDNPVLLPVPDMYYLTKIEARKITRNTFDNILSTVGVSQFSTAPYEDFNSINTTSFTTNLYNVITDTVNEYYDRSGYDAENELIDALKPLFPDDGDCDKYPEKIYSLDVIIHITWMVLQTWFDSLSQKETHMSVDNPFTVRNHIWTAAQNSDCYE